MRVNDSASLQRHSVAAILIVALCAISEFILVIYGGAYLWKTKSDGPPQLPYISAFLFIGSDLLSRKYLASKLKQHYSFKDIINGCLISCVFFGILIRLVGNIYISSLMLVLTGAAVGPVVFSIFEEFTEKFGAGDSAIPMVTLIVVFLFGSIISIFLLDKYIMVNGGFNLVPTQFAVCNLLALAIKNTLYY